MQFDSAVDYTAIISMLRKSIKSSPLELKMLWLCELILVSTYLRLRETAINKKYKADSVNLKYTDVAKFGTFSTPVLASVYDDLCAYRHEFVHHGHLEAMHILVKICNEQKSELLLLSNEFGVPLTFDNTIFLRHI